MQYNFDFFFFDQLINASQMLGEIETFHCNRNVHNVSWYGKLNFLRAPHLIWGTDYQIPENKFLLVLKNVNGEDRKFLFLYPFSEKASGPMSSKVDVMKFL